MQPIYQHQNFLDRNQRLWTDNSTVLLNYDDQMQWTKQSTSLTHFCATVQTFATNFRPVQTKFFILKLTHETLLFFFLLRKTSYLHYGLHTPKRKPSEIKYLRHFHLHGPQPRNSFCANNEGMRRVIRSSKKYFVRLWIYMIFCSYLYVHVLADNHLISSSFYLSTVIPFFSR